VNDRPPSGPRDVFEEVLALLTPQRLLHDPRATGEGVRVCVVDSGVERGLLEEKFRRAGQDIHPIAPRVRLYSADVFGPQGSCEVEVVIRALRWAMDVWGCKVINLSLGVPEQRLQQVQRRLQLLRTVEEAYYRDVLVIAAAHNDHPLERSYPAAFAPPLLSVDKGLFADPLQFAYRLREQVEFQAHGRGYLGPFAAEPATSWAAPHLAGIAARLLSLRPGLKPFEVKTILYWMFQAQRR